jgi:hypothetical protein
MGLFNHLKQLFTRHNLSGARALSAFVETRAAFLAQKSISEYAQARANMMFSTLLSEKGFQNAYEAARWRSYPASLSMMLEITAGALRTRLHASADEATRAANSIASAVIGKMRGHGPLTDTEWDAALDAIGKDLAKSMLAAPREAHAVARNRAREIFDALPFHTAIKQHDFDMFSNTVAFHLTELATELEEATLPKTLLKDFEIPQA